MEAALVQEMSQINTFKTMSWVFDNRRSKKLFECPYFFSVFFYLYIHFHPYLYLQSNLNHKWARQDRRCRNVILWILSQSITLKMPEIVFLNPTHTARVFFLFLFISAHQYFLTTLTRQLLRMNVNASHSAACKCLTNIAFVCPVRIISDCLLKVKPFQLRKFLVRNKTWSVRLLFASV